MPNWKKVITTNSDAELNSLIVKDQVIADTFEGDGSKLTGITDTNTTYSVGDGGLTQKNFTTALKAKLEAIPVVISNTNVDIGTEFVNAVDYRTVSAAFFDFVVKKGTNLRAGTVTAVHDGNKVEYTETSTSDLGNTTPLTLSVTLSGVDMVLFATATSNDWEVKTLVRAI